MMPLSSIPTTVNTPVFPLNGVLGGTATITVVFVLAATGTKTASGNATIPVVFTLTGTGTKTASGASTIPVAFTLTATGTKSTGIGPPPRPRIRWQFIAGPASGGHDLALTEAHGRRFTAKLVDPSECGFSLDGRHPQALAVDELSRDVHVLWTSSEGDTRILFRGRVGSSADSLDDTSHDLAVTVLDYRAVLNRRNLYSDSTLTWTATDQSQIAWGLIQQTQTRDGGDLGISQGVGQTSGTLRDRTYEAGDSIGQRVSELSQVINGFDWDITPTSASSLAFDVWGQRGADRGVVLEYGGLVSKVQRQVDPGDYGNALRMTGADGLTAQELEADDLPTRAEGRWDVVVGDTDLTTQSALNDRAAWQIAQSEVLQPTYTLSLRQGAWDGPDHIWLGDLVKIVVMSGRLAVNTSLRVYEMAFTLSDDGSEGVDVTVGGPRPDFRKRAAMVDRRLSTLERR